MIYRKLPQVISLLLLIVFSTAAWAYEKTAISGRVTAKDAEGKTTIIVGGTVTITGSPLGAGAITLATDEKGAFISPELPAGDYSVTIEYTGFEPLTQNVSVTIGMTSEGVYELQLGQVTSVVEVSAEGRIETTDATPQVKLNAPVLNNAPLVSERFTDVLPLVPGVVRGPDGLLNVKGARANASGLLVNSTNATDPVTGGQGISLPLDAVESVQVLSSPYLAEYGKFAGAVTSVATKMGTNDFKVQVNNFVPRTRRREDPNTGKSKLVGIESFTPRLGISGPIIKDKLFFAQTFQYRFVRTKIDTLPDPQEPPTQNQEVERDNSFESFDSFTQVNYVINPRNTLLATFSLYPQNNDAVTLNTFNPPLVTPNYKQRGFQFALSETAIFNNKLLLESTFSFKRFDAEVFPAGDSPMIIGVELNTGNFFNRQERDTDRIEVAEVLNYQLTNRHTLKFGVDIAHNTFDGEDRSRIVEIRRANNSLSERITFDGNILLERDVNEYTVFIQDKWLVNPRLTFDMGLRYDRESIADENNLAPRFGFVVVPTTDNRTAIRGGIGLFYNKVPINVGTFLQRQNRIITLFDTDGQTVIDGPRRFDNVIPTDDGKPRTPYSLAFNIELNRELAPGLNLRVGYQQRNGRRELTIDQFTGPNQAGQLVLANAGLSRYREFEVTTRYRFGEAGQDIVASYVRSQAIGNLNDYNLFIGNFQQPIIRSDEVGLLPFDARNRFLIYGVFNLPRKVSISPVADVRNGFPFSFVDEEQQFIGKRNAAGRFPTFFSLDMKIAKDFRVKVAGKKYKFQLGVRFFNLTNHFNPRDIQNNAASGFFRGFDNSVGRLVRGSLKLEF
ncbi:MAG: TonB-dependent receptor [Acidobacteriota bacterium]